MHQLKIVVADVDILVIGAIAAAVLSLLSDNRVAAVDSPADSLACDVAYYAENAVAATAPNSFVES
eukprot:CAMPEP_0184420872 /NCGR_PEP_ID=MMETSP0738-20130409/56483_1 /TAXON_ID=385413 /ORGANISM="Thalassiosira miniscula, Strain CCMP1093" /LENGTH=65 /DNA_ID=CAMNT_0026781995 /DNA_START=130 /DNA_END=324 /DNA_ORIENTATION=+